jgi:hypothetical protein
VGEAAAASPGSTAVEGTRNAGKWARGAAAAAAFAPQAVGIATANVRRAAAAFAPQARGIETANARRAAAAATETETETEIETVNVRGAAVAMDTDRGGKAVG